MMEWTKSARDEYERCCESLQAGITPESKYAELDPEELLEDIRRHVYEDLVASGAQTITQEHVRQAFARLDVHDWCAVEASVPRREAGTQSPGRSPWIKLPVGCAPTIFIVFGILLPALTLLVELNSGMCADEFFDPIPTVWHALLVATVPVGCALLFFSPSSLKLRLHKPYAVLLGLIGIVAAFYTLLFMPVLPMAFFGLALFGIGLMPLSPAISVIAIMLVGDRFFRDVEPHVTGTLRRLWGGVALGFLALLLARSTSTLTNIGLRMATSDTVESRAEGIVFLRRFGNEEAILQNCYFEPGFGGLGIREGRNTARGSLEELLLGTVTPITSSEARDVYYRVTGRPFNDVPPPEGYLGAQGWRAPKTWGEFDRGFGLDQVSRRLRGLELAESLLDVKLEPDAAVGYLEWTLEFKNSVPREREARALIDLPSGAVVSRVTLWIDGEEREAAFGGREQTRNAYRAVVRRRLDPLLVTTAGQDHVLVQCFPVPPDGGRMKIRIGLTVPLPLHSGETIGVPLPVFSERNFGLAEGLTHSLWVESSAPLEDLCGDLEARAGASGRHVLRGFVSDQRLNDGRPLMRGSRRQEVLTAVAQLEGEQSLVVQTLGQEDVAPPRRVALVVDGSVAMGEYAAAIGDALLALPDSIEFVLLIAGDTLVEEPLGEAQPAARREQGSAALLDFVFEGGRDCVPALVRAFDYAGDDGEGEILWLHGPQPFEFEPIGPLIQHYVRADCGTIVRDVSVKAGPNVVALELGAAGVLRPLMRRGELEFDLTSLFDSWKGTTQRLVLKREQIPNLSLRIDPIDTVSASEHLVRLWVYDEVKRLLAVPGDDNREQATALAAKHALVTPVTGAVVLESKEQYEGAGLQPVDPSEVPSVPEPEMILLVVGVLLLLLFSLWQRRRKGMTA